jgi:hypothetical protein
MWPQYGGSGIRMANDSSEEENTFAGCLAVILFYSIIPFLILWFLHYCFTFPLSVEIGKSLYKNGYKFILASKVSLFNSVVIDSHFTLRDCEINRESIAMDYIKKQSAIPNMYCSPVLPWLVVPYLFR